MIIFLYDQGMKTYKYRIDGKDYEVAVNSVMDGKADVAVNGVSYVVEIEPQSGKSVSAPLPGRIVEVLVAPGEVVKAGQAVAVLEAMKMENEILSEYSGTVSQVCVSDGEIVPAGGVIVVIG